MNPIFRFLAAFEAPLYSLVITWYLVIKPLWKLLKTVGRGISFLTSAFVSCFEYQLFQIVTGLITGIAIVILLAGF